MFTFGRTKIPQIDAKEVKQALDAKENVVLLDVRTIGEFEKARIDKSISLPIQNIPIDIEKVAPDKSQKIYVYCFSGSRSLIAVEELIKLGYTNVFNLTNGLLAWRANKFPMVA